MNFDSRIGSGRATTAFKPRHFCLPQSTSALPLCAVVLGLYMAMPPGTTFAGRPDSISEEWRHAAEAGDFSAIARAALNAKRRKAFKEAADWYKLGAELGDSNSQLNYALMLQNGLGVSKDERKALHWLLAASRGGMPYALLVVAEMYEGGQGTERNLVEAWARAAAALDSLQSSEIDAVERARSLKTKLEAVLSLDERERARQRLQELRIELQREVERRTNEKRK